MNNRACAAFRGGAGVAVARVEGALQQLPPRGFSSVGPDSGVPMEGQIFFHPWDGVWRHLSEPSSPLPWRRRPAASRQMLGWVLLCVHLEDLGELLVYVL